MDIPITTLLDKISMQANEAKRDVTAGDEKKVRERLNAIKALCELVLEEETKVKPIQPKIEHYSQKRVMSTKPLDEDDANGEDIFDF